ncbi:MAG: hypothetical protein C0604_01460, partial [Clostridiales bacterium]
MNLKSLERKVVAGISIAMGIICLAVLLTLLNMNSIRSGARGMTEQQIPSLEITNGIQSEYQSLTIAVRNYVANPDDESYSKAKQILVRLNRLIDGAQYKIDGEIQWEQFSTQLEIAKQNIYKYEAFLDENQNIIDVLTAEDQNLKDVKESYFETLGKYFDRVLIGRRAEALRFAKDLYLRGFEVVELKQQAVNTMDPIKIEEGINILESISSDIDEALSKMADSAEIELFYNVRTTALEYKDSMAKMRLSWSKLESIESQREELETQLFFIMDQTGTVALNAARVNAENSTMAAGKTYIYLLTVLLFAVACGIGLYLYMRKGILVPINEMTEVAGR